MPDHSEPARQPQSTGSGDHYDLPDLSSYGAVLFDLDGVLTPTADVHMRAWASLFNDYLTAVGAGPAYSDDDYFDHIDGKPRYEGVAALLASRGISLPWGDPDDPPESETVCGLGNRKNAVFRRVLEDEGVAPYPGSVAILDRLAALGIAMAVVSSSRNAKHVLAASGLAERFTVVVDGLSAAAENLAGKPEAETYLRAAELVGVPAARSVVVEDALSGVEAGRRGAFGLVVGVDRGAGREALLASGADLVVADLAELAAAVGRSRVDQLPGLGAAAPLGPDIDRRRYPLDEWRLIQRGRPSAADRGHAETIFALGNGYLGLRGNDDEGGEAFEHGTFINGFHETWPLVYPEAAYGFAEVGQTILNLPDGKTLELEVDGEPFDIDSAELEAYERVLDMAAGVLERRLVWRAGSGKRFELRSRRLVSFTDKHLAAISYSVTSLDADAKVTLRSLLLDRQELEVDDPSETATFDPRRSENMSGALQPRLHGATGVANERVYLAHATRGSSLGLAVMATHQLEGGEGVEPKTLVTPRRAQSSYDLTVARGVPVTLNKLLAYHDGAAADLEDLVEACDATLSAATALGAAELLAEQRRWLDEFWSDGDVRITGQPAVQQALRWNLFQLVQAGARADGRGISAKGVSGSGYSGHYFWDTEIYVLPYFIHSRPEIARRALEFRHAMLPAARRRARVMSERGALFPWRTINGEEASAYYPAGTAQYHIDADITYAVAKYFAATADNEFMTAYGAEIAAETARLWASLGFFEHEEPEAFHINSVTGPDEYSAVVDDNFYTNVMAAFNLRFAVAVFEHLEQDSPQEHARLLSASNLDPGELAIWRRAADAMTVMFDGELGIHVQDAGFLHREPWDLTATPPEQRPLLLHFHPLVIYRHQVLKQADLVLALYLQARHFSTEQKRRNFDYYDPLTTGDSTLSAAVQSIIAAEVGHSDLAMTYFNRMLYVDLDDLHGNTADGVHIASAGGTWHALVGGFAGMREDGGVLRFDPRLPQEWVALSFVVRHAGAKLRVTIEADRATFVLEDGPAVSFEVRGQVYELAGAEPKVVGL